MVYVGSPNRVANGFDFGPRLACGAHVEASSAILRYPSQRLVAADPNAYIKPNRLSEAPFPVPNPQRLLQSRRGRRRERPSEGKSKKIPNANSIPQHRLLLLPISDRNPKALPVLPPSSTSSSPSPSRSFPRRPDPLLGSRSRPADPFGHRSVPNRECPISVSLGCHSQDPSRHRSPELPSFRPSEAETGLSTARNRRP